MKIRCAFVLALVLALCGCRRPSADPHAEAAAYARQAGIFWQKAAGLYERLVRQSPDDRQLAFELGVVYFDKGDFAAAVAPLRRAGSWKSAPEYLGIALYRQAAYADALAVFSAIPEPSDQARYFHARTCSALNLYDQAVALLGAIGPLSSWHTRAQEQLQEIEKHRSGLMIAQVDPEAARLIAQAPESGAYPQAAGLILWCDEKQEITPDNRSVTTLRYMVKVLNERGKEQYAEMPLEYDSTFETVRLEYARTIKPGGEIVDVGSRHVRDVSKYLNFPLYSNARIMLISFPEVVEGAVVEFRAVITRTQLLNKTDFMLPYRLQSNDPIMACRFELNVPAGREVFIKPCNPAYNDFNARLEPRVSQAAGRRSYLWEFEHIPQIVPEPDMPPESQINPGFIISSFSSWQAIYSWWWGLAKEKIQPDRAIAAAVKELTAGLRSDREKAQAVHHFCSQKIRYVAVEYGDAGYEPHPAADIYRNKYGDCKDQAILLVTMLRQAGLSAWPVLIGTREHYDLDPGFPAVLFNHAIACVQLDGQLVFLDPTAETCAFGDLPLGDQDRQVLVIKDDGYQIAGTPAFGPQHNRVRQTLLIEAGSQGAVSGSKSVESFGVYDQGQRYWLLYTMPEAVKDTITANLQDMGVASRLIEYSTSDVRDLCLPVNLRYTFSSREFFTEAGPLRILPQISRIDAGLTAKQTRRYPLDLGFAGTQETETRIELPAGFVAEYVPQALREDSPWVDLDVTSAVSAHSLIVRQRMVTKQRQIPVADYPAFKSFMENASARLRERIVLRKER